MASIFKKLFMTGTDEYTEISTISYKYVKPNTPFNTNIVK